MNSDIVESLRKELLDITFQIALIEKNRRLNDQEREAIKPRLEQLKKAEEEIRSKLKHQIYEDTVAQKRGGRI